MVRKHTKLTPLICTIDLTGFAMVMVTVVFVLLTTLMTLPTTFDCRTGLTLPTAHHLVAMPRANRENAMVITIAADGKVHFDQELVLPEKLPALIRERLTGSAERRVYLIVDRYAKYRVVILVLAEVRSAGVENIAFLVENVRTVGSLWPRW